MTLSSPLTIPKWIIVLLISIPILLYFYMVIKFSVNAPYWDDYDTILSFTMNYLETDSIGRKISLLLAQANEHRILLDRLLILIQYNIFGSINFQHLIILGNVMLLGLFILVYKIFKKDVGEHLTYFLPAGFIFFQYQYYNCSLWATPSIQTFGVLLLAFSSIYILANYKSTKYLLISMALALIATYTNGNGFFVLPVGVLILIHQKRPLEMIISWVAFSAVTLMSYFYGYERPEHHPALIETLIHPIQLVEYGFTLMGSYLSNSKAVFFGLVLTLIILFVFYKRIDRTSPSMFYILLFILITIGVTSLTRSGFGVEQALSPRYRLYPAIIFIFCYFGLLKSTNNALLKNITFAIFLAISVKMGHKSLSKISNIDTHSNNLKLSSIRPLYPNIDRGLNVLKKSDEANIFSLSKDLINETVSKRIKLNLPKVNNDISIQFSLDQIDGYLINNPQDFIFTNNGIVSNRTVREMYVVLKSENSNYIFETSDKKSLRYFGKKIENYGFQFVIPISNLASDSYKIGVICISQEGKEYFRWLKKSVYIVNDDFNVYSGENAIYHFDRIKKNKNNFLITGWVINKGHTSNYNNIYLQLKGESNDIIVFPTKKIYRPGVTKKYSADKINYDSAGFKLLIPIKSIEKGKYGIDILNQGANNIKLSTELIIEN